MSSIKLRILLSLVLISISLLFNPCQASNSIFGDPDNSYAGSSHTTSARASVTRLAGGYTRDEDEGSEQSSSNHASVARFVPDPPQYQPDTSADDAATVPADIDASPNGTFAAPSPDSAAPHKPAQLEEASLLADVEEYVNVASTQPGFNINDGMFAILMIPESTTPYKKISLVRCVCFNPLNPSSFQNNPELTHIILTDSHLNLLGSEEKLGEGCPKLEHIDLRNTVDLSIDKDTPITPGRFAQLAHPDLLLRILSAQCKVSILNPEHEGTCYTVDEMKAKFLRSVVELRSAQKSQEGIYQRIMTVLAAGINEFDLKQLLGVSMRAAIKAGTGI